mgnify:CR=1 FL=1
MAVHECLHECYMDLHCCYISFYVLLTRLVRNELHVGVVLSTYHALRYRPRNTNLPSHGGDEVVTSHTNLGKVILTKDNLIYITPYNTRINEITTTTVLQ